MQSIENQRVKTWTRGAWACMFNSKNEILMFQQLRLAYGFPIGSSSIAWVNLPLPNEFWTQLSNVADNFLMEYNVATPIVVKVKKDLTRLVAAYLRKTNVLQTNKSSLLWSSMRGSQSLMVIFGELIAKVPCIKLVVCNINSNSVFWILLLNNSLL